MLIRLEKSARSKNNNIFNTHSKSLLGNQRLGVLKNTTNSNIIRQTYPSQYQDLVEVFDDSDSLHHKLKQKKISGYMSDEILLKDYLIRNKDYLIRNKDTESCYKIIPDNHWLSYEEYGVIIYYTNKDTGKMLFKKINDWIKENPLKITEEYENKYTNLIKCSCYETDESSCYETDVTNIQ